MPHTVNAKDAIGIERDPGTDGGRLAEYICAEGIPLKDLTIDVRELAPEDLVSSFVNALLVALERGGCDISNAKAIKWQAKFASEKTRLEELVAGFLKVTKKSARAAG